jgi:hypothetical protein
LNDDHVRSASSSYQPLELAVSRSKAASALAAYSFTLPSLNKSWPTAPSHPSKVSKKPVRVNPLAYSLCDEVRQKSWNPFADGRLRTQERMDYTTCKDDLRAYSLFYFISSL